MTYDFHSIALALSGPRGSGRTYNTIITAPDNARILVTNKQQGDVVLNMAADHGRYDLSTMNLSSTVRGLKGPFVIDHHAVEQLLHEAGKLQKENENLKQENQAHKINLKAVGKLNKQLKAKLSEYGKGIPIEKAKDGQDYLLVIKSGDEIIRVAGRYHGETTVNCNPPFTLGPRWETDLNYRFYFYEEDKEETELLGVHPLPTQIPETQEGS